METKTLPARRGRLKRRSAPRIRRYHPQPGKDYSVSKVTAWGLQFGGFTQQTRFWVEIGRGAPARRLSVALETNAVLRD